MEWKMFDQNGLHVMTLSYKPNLNDIIRDDETGIYFKVHQISETGMSVFARRKFAHEG